MKKLIAIAVVFALATSFVFAETKISGTVSVRGLLVSDTLNDVENTAVMTGQVETVYVELSGTNDEGTFGGLFRLRGNEVGTISTTPRTVVTGVTFVPTPAPGDVTTTTANVVSAVNQAANFHRAFAWWKPIPQLQIFFGQDPDGKFAPYNAWSFFQGQENYANVHDWGAWRQGSGNIGNWDTFGLAFSLYLVDGLEVNIVVPLPGTDNQSKNFQDVLGGSLQLAASYAIPQIGKLFLNVVGPGQNIFADYTGITGKEKIANYGRLGVSFLLTAIEGLDVQASFMTGLAGADENQPAALGLFANYSGGDFGVKFRSRLALNSTGGIYSYNKDTTEFAFDVQPWYNFGTFTAYLSVGMVSTKGATGDPVNQFVLNPYIRASFGSGSIRLGVVYQDTNLDQDKDATIKVPLVFGYSF